jgi:RNA polymerase sigma factor (sigma-70 family)
MSSYPGNRSEFADLWQLIKHGDKQALGILFKETNNRMFNYGYKIIEDNDLIKDAIQDVFVTIWRRRTHLADVTSVPAYLFVALKMRLYRLIQNELKKSEKEIDLKQEENSFILSEEEIRISDETDIRKRKILAKAINKLPPQKREVVYLFFYNGMDYDEISEIMNIDVQTVRNYMSMAIKKIRNVFNVEGEYFTG